jgi:hypothetical protein
MCGFLDTLARTARLIPEAQHRRGRGHGWKNFEANSGDNLTQVFKKPL